MTPLFIVGVPRSGTTLMRSLMRVFDGVYLPPDEFQLLPVILLSDLSPEQLRTTIQKSNFADHMRRRDIWPGDAFLDEISKAGNGPLAFQSLVTKIAEQDEGTQPVYWGDKTPENLFHLDAIFRTWPEAKIIHVLRDPRSTVLSMKTSWGRSTHRGSVIWRDGIQAIAKFNAGRNACQVYEIQYEALTQDPEWEIAKVGKWLNLPFDPAALNDFQTEERWSATKQSGIQKRGADWDNPEHLSDAKVIESICFDAMTSTGYVPKYATSVSTPSKARLKFSKVGDAWRVLRLYAKERGWPEAISYKVRQWRSSRLR